MNRLIRTLVNSSGSRRFTGRVRRRPGPVPVPGSPTGVSSPNTRPSYRVRQFLNTNFYQRTFFTAALPHQRPGPAIHNLVRSISSMNENRNDENCEDVSANAGAGDDQRKMLPEELSRSVITLSCESSAEGGVCNVYLVGTNHLSQESCQEVQAVISYLKPQVVFLELCSSRRDLLTARNLEVPTMREMAKIWKKKQDNIFGILYSWTLAKVANKLEVLPGSEFRVAYEEALKYGGKVILGDRPVKTTLQRAWGKMSLWNKTKSLCYLVYGGFFLSSQELKRTPKKMDNGDTVSKEFPTLMETILHERDQYMSSAILRVASEHSSVVAVVGKSHLQGIKKNWKQLVEVKNVEFDILSDKQVV